MNKKFLPETPQPVKKLPGLGYLAQLFILKRIGIVVQIFAASGTGGAGVVRTGQIDGAVAVDGEARNEGLRPR